MLKILRSIGLLAMDLLILSLLTLSLVIFLSGGFVLSIQGHEILAQRARNPMIYLFALSALRFLLAPNTPFLLIPSSKPNPLFSFASRVTLSLHSWLDGLTADRAKKVVFWALVGSLVLKAANDWFYYGFTYGDSVEIHAMTFSVLWHRDLEVWNLRSPFYPILFVFPIQWLLSAVGVTDPRVLIFSGRMIVTGFSLLNVWFVFKIGTNLWKKYAPAVLAAVFLAFNRLHIVMGSAEEPRTVASTFLLICFWILISRSGLLWAAVAGFALGIGSALRFGEALFLVPMAIQLIIEKRSRDLLVAVLFAGIAWILVLGPGDLLYWNEPFYSLRNMIEFTVVKRLSSTGYQPIWTYLTIAPVVTDLFTIGLFFYSLRLRPWKPALWCLVPLLFLCFFQTKSERYLVPLLPFFVLCVGLGAWDLIKRATYWTPKLQLLVLFILLGAFVFELEGFRSRSPREAIDIVQDLATRFELQDLMMEDVNLNGTKLYVPPTVNMINIDSEKLSEPNYFRHFVRRKEAQYILLKTESIRIFELEKLLKARGFQEIPSAGADPKYRLFKRKPESSERLLPGVPCAILLSYARRSLSAGASASCRQPPTRPLRAG